MIYSTGCYTYAGTVHVFIHGDYPQPLCGVKRADELTHVKELHTYSTGYITARESYQEYDWHKMNKVICTNCRKRAEKLHRETFEKNGGKISWATTED